MGLLHAQFPIPKLGCRDTNFQWECQEPARISSSPQTHGKIHFWVRVLLSILNDIHWSAGELYSKANTKLYFIPCFSNSPLDTLDYSEEQKRPSSVSVGSR